MGFETRSIMFQNWSLVNEFAFLVFSQGSVTRSLMSGACVLRALTLNTPRGERRGVVRGVAEHGQKSPTQVKMDQLVQVVGEALIQSDSKLIE